MKANPALAPLERAVGTWTVTGSHPYLPGRTLRGKVTFERIERGAFLRMHSKMEDPEIPEGVAIFGTDGDDDTLRAFVCESESDIGVGEADVRLPDGEPLVSCRVVSRREAGARLRTNPVFEGSRG